MATRISDGEYEYVEVCYEDGKLIEVATGVPYHMAEKDRFQIRSRCPSFDSYLLYEPKSYVPFLAKETELLFWTRKHLVTDFLEGFIGWSDCLEKYKVLDKHDDDPVLQYATLEEDLFVRFVLKENLWLRTRGYKPASLSKCVVSVPAWEQLFLSVSEAIAASIRLSQRTRRSAAANAFRCCLVPVNDVLVSLDYCRRKVTKDWAIQGPYTVFPDEPRFVYGRRLKLSPIESKSAMWVD